MAELGTKKYNLRKKVARKGRIGKVKIIGFIIKDTITYY